MAGGSKPGKAADGTPAGNFNPYEQVKTGQHRYENDHFHVVIFATPTEWVVRFYPRQGGTKFWGSFNTFPKRQQKLLDELLNECLSNSGLEGVTLPEIPIGDLVTRPIAV